MRYCLINRGARPRPPLAILDEMKALDEESAVILESILKLI
jgi:hypothetical protein